VDAGVIKIVDHGGEIVAAHKSGDVTGSEVWIKVPESMGAALSL